jgi:hypothetical protein
VDGHQEIEYLVRIDKIDRPLEWAIGNRNDKRASSGCGENYMSGQRVQTLKFECLRCCLLPTNMKCW